MSSNGIDPVIQTKESAGADLFAYDDVIVPAKGSAIIRTGYTYHVAVPGTFGMIRGRSSLAFHHRVFVFEGTIDSDYAGKEVNVLLLNHSNVDFRVTEGMRIAQLVITKHNTNDYYRTKEAIRNGGIGSTDKE